MRMLGKLSCVQIHKKQDNSEHSTGIILQCIQDLKMEVYA